MARDPDELQKHLREQLDFLRSSADRFDSGEPHFAKQLAVTLRTLLHSTDRSSALLDQIGILNSLQMIDTGGEIVPGDSMVRPTPPLTVLVIKARSQVLPLSAVMEQGPRVLPRDLRVQTRFVREQSRRISRAGDWHPFETWWSKLFVLGTPETRLFHRRDAVLALANKEGGAHLDPKVPAWLRTLAEGKVANVTLTDADGSVVTHDPLPATVRQIAYEVEQGLHRLDSDLGSPHKPRMPELPREAMSRTEGGGSIEVVFGESQER
jgi:hypothetical protein